MSEEKDLAPRQEEVESTGVDTNNEMNEALIKMCKLPQMAVQSFLVQNVQNADMAANTAIALYADWSRFASPEEELMMRILKHLTCLYAPLTRILVYQTEGHFSKALSEIEKGLPACSDAIATIDEYSRLPNADENISQIKPVLTIFPILFRGFDASVRAEFFGYRGDIPQYTKLLQKAVAEFRQTARLPPSSNETFLALIGLCSSIADRLETRIEVFSAVQGIYYLYPTGDKIFIVHGRDEAKWRELRDLLEDKFNLKTTVLMEEPGAGKTLIQKFEDYANDCCYAFVLLTPDDFVEDHGKSYFQARPNVLFELGWFYGHFGRDRVCIIKKDTTQIPSDLAGILSINFHEAVSEGFVQIQDELQRIGIIPGAHPAHT